MFEFRHMHDYILHLLALIAHVHGLVSLKSEQSF